MQQWQNAPHLWYRWRKRYFANRLNWRQSSNPSMYFLPALTSMFPVYRWSVLGDTPEMSQIHFWRESVMLAETRPFYHTSKVTTFFHA